MDPFATLGIEARLVLPEDRLRETYRAAGGREHPDAGGSGEGFAELQEAYVRLASPSKRLRAWLQLRGASGDERGTISPELVDLFGKVGGVLQQAEAAARRRDEARSTLAKAMAEPAVLAAREALEAALGEVGDAIRAEEAGFPAIEGGAGDPWRSARDLAFLEKWQARLKSAFAGLW